MVIEMVRASFESSRPHASIWGMPAMTDSDDAFGESGKAYKVREKSPSPGVEGPVGRSVREFFYSWRSLRSMSLFFLILIQKQAPLFSFLRSEEGITAVRSFDLAKVPPSRLSPGPIVL